jgi:glutamate--cysteine ligase
MSLLISSSDEPIKDRNQLVEYFAKSAKPKERWLIGCEHEKFPYRPATLKPVSYDEPKGLRDFMNTMSADYGWKPIYDEGNVIGLTRGKAAITFEPGGQVELSGAPLANLHETAAELDNHLSEACDVGERLDINWLGCGFHPTAKREDISWVPKTRYKIMRDYMPKVGKLGLDMMLRTCTVQVNLDYSDEPDMVKKFRVALALQPIATALFATSPFKEGAPSGYLSTRMNVWTDTDNDRCGAPQFVFAKDFGYERYTDYALDVPMYFIVRDGKYIDCAGQSFRDFMAGKLPARPGEKPTLGDWTNHLTTLFPDVRLKNILEMRGADAGPAEMLLALPSFWVGILYDAKSLDSAWEIMDKWTAEDRLRLQAEVPQRGFEADVRGKKVLDIAHELINIAHQGLRRRMIRLHGGADETRYLDILLNLTESKQSIADTLLMQMNHFENFSMQTVYDACRLVPPPKADVA